MVKITALPRDISPNEIIKVQNTSKCCPLCRETGGFGYTFKNNGKIQFTGIITCAGEKTHGFNRGMIACNISS